MATDVPEIDKKNRRDYLKLTVSVITCVLGLWAYVPAQQPIAPVDFRPFVDGRNWIVRQPLVSTGGFQPVSTIGICR